MASRHFRALWLSDVHLGTNACRAAAAYAASRGFDGVVCGHIHRPGIRLIDGIRYANDGDRVEHRIAIAEDQAGQLLLLSYSPSGTTILAAEAMRDRVAA